MTKNILPESQKTSLTSLTSCLAGHQGLENNSQNVPLKQGLHKKEKNASCERLIIMAVTAILSQYYCGYGPDGKHFL